MRFFRFYHVRLARLEHSTYHVRHLSFRRVIAKSGVRLNAAKSQLDLALIESPMTYSKNKPLPASAFHRGEQFPDGMLELFARTNDSVVRTLVGPSQILELRRKEEPRVTHLAL